MTPDERLVMGNTSPVVVIDRDGVYIDGKLLPILVADEAISVTTEPGNDSFSANGLKTIRLTLMTWGPVVIDTRLDDERDNNTVVVTNPPNPA